MGVRNPKPRIEGGWGGMRGGGGSRFRVPRFYYAPLKFYLATKKDTWEQHPANLIPPLTTKHASALVLTALRAWLAVVIIKGVRESTLSVGKS